jgi:hypothetical protein
MTLHKGNIFYSTSLNIYHIHHVSHDMCRHNPTHTLWHIIRLIYFSICLCCNNPILIDFHVRKEDSGQTRRKILLAWQLLFHRGGRGSFPGQTMWWTKPHGDMSECSCFPPSAPFHQRLISLEKAEGEKPQFVTFTRSYEDSYR